MRSTAILGMRPTRAFQMRATQALRMQATPALRLRQSKVVRAGAREEQRAHTISQRLNTFRKIPVELLPLAAVIGVALVAAGYSIFHKLFSDKTLRLTRTGPAPKPKEDH